MLTALAVIFFKVGLFAIGGGLASLPLLKAYVVDTGWISNEMFVNMIAISESTPGPIAINMATFVGYQSAGIPGALVATGSLVLPSFLIMLLIARFMRSFDRHPVVRDVMGALRPAVIGMIAAAAWSVLDASVLNTGILLTTHRADAGALLIFALLALAYIRWKGHPFIYILAGAGLALLWY